jgi:hypothetical protein
MRELFSCACEMMHVNTIKTSNLLFILEYVESATQIL